MKPSDPDKACPKCGLPKMYCRCRSLLSALGGGLLTSIAFLGVLYSFAPAEWRHMPHYTNASYPTVPHRIVRPRLFYAVYRDDQPPHHYYAFGYEPR